MRPDDGPEDDEEYEVQPGDCLDSIAFEHGHFWRTLWNLPDNADLREARENPNILMPGDRVVIPPVRVKRVRVPTGTRHAFQLRGVPAKVRLRFLEAGDPLSGVAWEMKVDGKPFSGTLDDEGVLVQSIAPNAKSVEVRLAGDEEWIVVPLGSVDPITEVSGVQGRLSALGFSLGPVDGISGPRTEAAIARFQRRYGLDVTGEMDDETSDKLRAVYGC